MLTMFQLYEALFEKCKPYLTSGKYIVKVAFARDSRIACNI